VAQELRHRGGGAVRGFSDAEPELGVETAGHQASPFLVVLLAMQAVVCLVEQE
jgi:hypothetical protein